MARGTCPHARKPQALHSLTMGVTVPTCTLAAASSGALKELRGFCKSGRMLENGLFCSVLGLESQQQLEGKRALWKHQPSDYGGLSQGRSLQHRATATDKSSGAPEPELNCPPARRVRLSPPGMAGKAEDRGRCEGRTHTSSSSLRAGSGAATETEIATQTAGD